MPLSLATDSKTGAESNKAQAFGLRPLFVDGRTTWRVAAADKVAFLIDADAFYRALCEAAESAQEQILILGWDTDLRTEMPTSEGPRALGDYLQALLLRKPQLRVHVLTWDFAFIYMFERESMPAMKFSQLGTDRLRYVLDHEHPHMASHHQKIVVVDDRIAFSGGLDITQRRWDTPEHKAFDERRVDPGGHIYGPFHDVQIAVSGEAASALGVLARERWQRATKEILVAPSRAAHETAWPLASAPDLENVRVGISRTLPAGYAASGTVNDVVSGTVSAAAGSGFGEGALSHPVCEIERLFIEMIARAKRFIYIENQYFTSAKIARAIARRLEEKDGPEILMILPRDQTGWIEESTMGLLRSEALQIVENADRSRRFRAYHPTVPGLGDSYVKVHSKVMIVDDELVRVGSANLNSRSLGLDTECDLTIDVSEAKDSRRAILTASLSRLRTSLMAEHLGADPSELARVFDDTSSLLATVDRFLGGERGLQALHPSLPPWLSQLAPPKDWIDPHAPRGIRRWLGRRFHRSRPSLGVLAVLGVFALLAFFYQADASPEWLAHPITSAMQTVSRTVNAENIGRWLSGFRGNPWAAPIVLLAYIIGTALLIPVSALIFGTLIAFPSVFGIALAAVGALLATAVMYGFGRYFAWTKSRFLNRPWVRNLSARLQNGGLWPLALLRLTPVAPFGAVAVAAGGLRVPFGVFLVATLIGLGPGLLTMALIVNGTIALSESGQTMTTLGLGLLLIVAVVVTGAFALKNWRARRA